MTETMAQSLAEQIRLQAIMAGRLLKNAGMGTEEDRTHEYLGPREASLTVAGNIADMAFTNHYFYLGAAAAGAFPGDSHADLQADYSADFPGYLSFLSPRETIAASEALERLQLVNREIAAAVENMTDEQLDAPLETAFGGLTLRRALFSMLLHGSLHMGQAWGVLKGVGVTQRGMEALFRD
jgi:hypothetical protein